MIEIWRDIKDYEGLYQVSNFGRVRSLGNGNSNRSKVKILKPGNTRGYLRVCLCKDGKEKNFLVHRLVAEAFIPNPLNLPQVNHKSEDKKDSRVENLEWCDHKYNMNYGTRNKSISKKNTNGKLSKPVLQYSQDGTLICEWVSASEIERQLGYIRGGISNCCRGETTQAYGYLWKYKGEE